ncbi:transcriptional regulator, TetR family [Parafrankia sp. EAN1pec]|uniref:TetR/AcrR family transcriptional regulator n=1 Tax=Parafrankia sp. (strain EAN1pec) TaxID=298653 RepID=UPI0000543F54|nr:transcriptional regulator, TetR family [Frankia sp. EAN1pec]
MNTVTGHTAPDRPGRKRSEESRLAILAAAVELVGEVGYAGLTIEGIAARSGAGKQTIYRWWPSKADVLLDALATKADLHVPIPDEGSYPADLRAFLVASFRLGRDRRVVDALRALMAHAQIDEEFRDRFRAAFLQRRRDALGIILDRARTRGDLPPVPSPGTAVDLVFGVIWYRMLATSQLVDENLIDELVATLAEPRTAQPQTAVDTPTAPEARST